MPPIASAQGSLSLRSTALLAAGMPHNQSVKRTHNGGPHPRALAITAAPLCAAYL